MINWQQELNKEQLDVVLHGDGPCLVLAGAGSGKTRTITYRVAYLLEKGIKPENILLVTFTNKAAKEMMERIRLLLSNCKDVACHVSTEGVKLPWAGTFHHIAYRLLKKYAEVMGYKNNFSVLDTEDSLDLIKLCLKYEGIDRKEKRFPSPAVLQSIISYARNSETTIADVLDLKYEHFLPISDTLVRLAEDYQKRKLMANVMDFDDLLVNWFLLLRTPPNPPLRGDFDSVLSPLAGGCRGVLAKYAEQFKYILVDEYQDTNKIQASIIDLLASKHRNLLVVGDDAQSIYSFRAAEIANILAFEKKYTDLPTGQAGAKVFKLETNYRSTPDILDLANNIIANNLKQYEKNLKAINTKFTKPELLGFANQSEEAQFIVGRILELQEEGVELNKMAVLFRASYHSQALEMELVKHGISYDYRGGTRFFERAHIKDVLAYLRIINNVTDTVAWRRILNMQVGIGPTWAERSMEFIVRSSEFGDDLSGVGAQLPARAQLGWTDFLMIYEKLKLVGDKNPSDLIMAVLDSKYVEYLENEYPDYRERLQDIEQLAGFAKNEKELSKFLAEATLQENFRSVETLHATSLQEGHEEKLILSTIHQAKGLEWDAVFILGLSAGQFPIDRALRERNGIEEERRLFYVAITRAKKYLYLTYSFGGSWGDTLGAPSMFIEEMDKDLVSAEGVGGGSVFDNTDEIEYVDEYDDGIRNTNSTKLRNVDNGMTSFLKGLDDL